MIHDSLVLDPPRLFSSKYTELLDRAKKLSICPKIIIRLDKSLFPCDVDLVLRLDCRVPVEAFLNQLPACRQYKANVRLAYSPGEKPVRELHQLGCQMQGLPVSMGSGHLLKLMLLLFILDWRTQLLDLCDTK